MLISAAHYAQMHGKDRATVLKLIYAERLPAQKIGNQWAIDDQTPFPADARMKSGKYVGWRKKSSSEPEQP